MSVVPGPGRPGQAGRWQSRLIAPMSREPGGQQRRLALASLPGPAAVAAHRFVIVIARPSFALLAGHRLKWVSLPLTTGLRLSARERQRPNLTNDFQPVIRLRLQQSILWSDLIGWLGMYVCLFAYIGGWLVWLHLGWAASCSADQAQTTITAPLGISLSVCFTNLELGVMSSHSWRARMQTLTCCELPELQFPPARCTCISTNAA